MGLIMLFVDLFVCFYYCRHNDDDDDGDDDVFYCMFCL